MLLLLFSISWCFFTIPFSAAPPWTLRHPLTGLLRHCVLVLIGDGLPSCTTILIAMATLGSPLLLPQSLLFGSGLGGIVELVWMLTRCLPCRRPSLLSRGEGPVGEGNSSAVPWLGQLAPRARGLLPW